MQSTRCWCCDGVNESGFQNCAHCRGPDGNGAPLLIGRYRVLSFQGGGQYGRVYKCHDPDLDRFVAIKLLGEPGNESLLKEIRAIAALNSSNIVQIHDAGSSFFVMEFVEGSDLGKLIKQNINEVRKRFSSLFLGICEGLRAAHEKKIVHRDIKPENIMLTADYKVKIADFGLAKHMTPSSPGTSRAGTPLYMAPEIWHGEEYDERVDIFSLGVLCYYVWTGKHLFEAHTIPALGLKITTGQYEPPESLNTAIPVVISDLIKQMLSPKESRAASIKIVQDIVSSTDVRPHLMTQRHLEDFQRNIDAIYGYNNQARPPIVLLSHLSTNVAGFVGGLLSPVRSYGEPRAKHYLLKSFAWLCALVSRLNCRIEELIWMKFSNQCPYCDHDKCTCPLSSNRTEPDINLKLLEKIRATPRVKYASQSFDSYKSMFQRIYGDRNKSAGLTSVSLHLFLEINEASDATLKVKSLQTFDSIDILQLEVADVIAWFFAIVNLVDFNYSFEAEFFKMFNGKCYQCTFPSCRCTDVTTEIQLFNWRPF